MGNETVLKLTRRGRRTMKAGLDGFSAELVLAMEVISRIKCGYLENIRDLTAELIDRYGSAENAVVALKTGKVGFEKVYPSLPNLTKGKAGPGRKKRGSKAGQGFSKGGVL